MSLRRKIYRAGQWMLANAAGWAVVGWGVGCIMGWSVGRAMGEVSGWAVGTVVTGMVIRASGGAITGIALVGLSRHPVPEA